MPAYLLDVVLVIGFCSEGGYEYIDASIVFVRFYKLIRHSLWDKSQY